MGDIVDSESAESLRERLSDRANAAISYWASLRPMGDLRLAEDGAVGAYISGVFRLIGYLGPEPQGDAEQIQGFAIVALYRVTESEILDSQSGRSLLAAASVDVAPIIATILAAVPAGGTIRVTNYGDVVRIDDAGKTKVAHVTPEQWFPGQLAL